MRSLRVVVMLISAAMFVAASLSAQTPSTSTVTGTVFDKTGAVVPKAKVQLTDLATNITDTTTTSADGGYTFPSVRPGTYKIAVTAAGFRQAVVSALKVDVGKAALVNVTLEVGEVTQTVEVQAGAGTELQTLDASVGNVLDENLLSRMPTLSRDATSLVLLQPTAIPGFNGPLGTTFGENTETGGGVAGSRNDQNTFLLDGGDATSNMEGAGGYNTGFISAPRATIPTPVESLEEFRVQTNNQNVTFARSSGAEIQMVTRRGSNAWHGAAYWYHQNDETNSNSWALNRIGREKAELRDNRYGGRLGGPIWKDRTFFFVHEEERHFLQQAIFSRLVPTPALRAGILEFRNSSGAVIPYNLNPTPTLNPGSGNPNSPDPNAGQTIAPSALDPRGKGISPAITATWNRLPLPNDYSQGDGLRSAAFTVPVPNVTNEHFAVVRLDHKISNKWDFMGSYRYSTTETIPPNYQVDIGGVLPGDKLGAATAVSPHPLQPRYLVAGLTGHLSPNLTNEFHFDWLRHWWAWYGPGPVNPISTTLSDAPLQIWQEDTPGIKGMVPLNVNTQRARTRSWNGRDFTWSDNLSWIKGKHMWNFGGRAQHQHLFHSRDDKVTGGLTTALYFVDRTSGLHTDIGGFTAGVSIPPTCPTAAPNCIKAGDVSNWKRAFISTLGLVDTASQVLTRDANLNPLAPHSIITQDTIVNSYDLHFSDTWRLKPSLTFTWGLTWGVQLPPFELSGKQMMVADANSGAFINAADLLNAKKVAALNSQVINPTLAYVPIGKTGRKYPYDPDYSNFGPRLAAAWNPSSSGGILGALLGERKTVLRGGWSRSFDRINGVGIVLVPALGVGFGDLSVCQAPVKTSTGVNCAGTSTPSTAFRIGVDGNHIPIPPLPPVSQGVIIPGQGATIPLPNANSVFEGTDFRLDPKRRIGVSDVIDFTIQRQLPGQMLIEVGYIGRWSRNLVENLNLNMVPYMFVAPGTKQSYADAFDKVAAQIQAGVLPSAVTPQPWFEVMLGPGGTRSAADSEQSFFASHGAGGAWVDLEPSFLTGPLTAFNTQVKEINWTTDNGFSNYHAGFVTLRKRPSHGLTFDVNYTFSKSLDILGFTQETTCTIPDAFNPSRSYAPSTFDRRHVFNVLVNYELPLGKGKQWATGGVADRIFGGWSFSGIYTAASGLPLFVYDSSACGTEFGNPPSADSEPVGMIPLQSGVFTTSRVDNPTIGSTFGTNSRDSNVPNAFPDPAKVANSFRNVTFADGRQGMGAVRGLFRWSFDFGFAKTTRITERVSTRFDVQFVNAFNHPMLGCTGCSIYTNGEPNTDQSDPAGFGVLPSQFNAPRFIQFGLRLDF